MGKIKYSIGKKYPGDHRPRNVQLWLQEASNDHVELFAGLEETTEFDSPILSLRPNGVVLRIGKVAKELGFSLNSNGDLDIGSDNRHNTGREVDTSERKGKELKR